LGLAQALLGAGGAQDIDIHQPSLEDLYRHYMDHAQAAQPGEGAL
jgi:Cu-processing system ATP-binding protein